MMIPQDFRNIHDTIATGKGRGVKRKSKRTMIVAGVIALLNATAGLGNAVELNAQQFELPEIGEEIALADERFANLENRDRILKHLADLRVLGNAIKTREYRVRFLLQLGRVYARLGATEQALGILKTSETLAESSEQLAAIANTYQAMGEGDRALATLKTVESQLEAAAKPLTYQWIGIAQTYRKLEAHDEAINALVKAETTAIAAGEQEGQPPMAFRLLWVAQQYKEMEALDRAGATLTAAMEAAQGMEDANLQVSALLSIGKLAGETGHGNHLLEALQAAQTQTAVVQIAHRRAFHLTTAAQIYQEFPQFSEQGDRLPIALALAQKAAAEIEQPWPQANSMVQIARVYMKLEQSDRALEILEQAEKAVLRGDRPEVNVYAMLPIANSYDDLGAREKAIATLDKVRTAVDQIEKPSARVSALLSLAYNYSTLEEGDRARETMDVAVAIVDALDSQREKVFQSLTVAQTYSALDQKDQALTTMTIVEEAIASLPNDDPGKVSALNQIAYTYQRLGASDRAIASLTKAQTLVQQQGDAYTQTFFMSGASQLYEELGVEDQALIAIENAQRVSENIEESWSKVNALINVAQGYGRLGDSARAFEILVAAQRTSSQIDNEQGKSGALVAIAFAYLGVEPIEQP